MLIAPTQNEKEIWLAAFKYIIPSTKTLQSIIKENNDELKSKYDLNYQQQITKKPKKVETLTRSTSEQVNLKEKLRDKKPPLKPIKNARNQGIHASAAHLAGSLQAHNQHLELNQNSIPMLDNTEPSKNKKDYFNSNQEIHATKTEKGASKIDFYDHQGKNKRRVVDKERIGVKSVPKGRVGKNIQMIETNDRSHARPS